MSRKNAKREKEFRERKKKRRKTNSKSSRKSIISLGSPVAAVIPFIPAVFQIIRSDDDTKPLILTGDLYVSFASEEAKPIIEFLKRTLKLTMNTDAREGTTRYGTTIDAVFSRFLKRTQSRIFISYFSYHTPVVCFLENNDAEN
ncbi:uncharacterized protein TNCV_3388021 [Trichonephila clavipes]|nr:uncharacterized protein TNCV_3388021 [Trichonephila clavipes]